MHLLIHSLLLKYEWLEKGRKENISRRIYVRRQMKIKKKKEKKKGQGKEEKKENLAWPSTHHLLLIEKST